MLWQIGLKWDRKKQNQVGPSSHLTQPGLGFLQIGPWRNSGCHSTPRFRGSRLIAIPSFLSLLPRVLSLDCRLFDAPLLAIGTNPNPSEIEDESAEERERRWAGPWGSATARTSLPPRTATPVDIRIPRPRSTADRGAAPRRPQPRSGRVGAAPPRPSAPPPAPARGPARTRKDPPAPSPTGSPHRRRGQPRGDSSAGRSRRRPRRSI